MSIVDSLSDVVAQGAGEFNAGDQNRTGVQTATIVQAFLRAEQIRTFNRLLLRRIAVLALGWLIVSRWMIGLSVAAQLVGCAVLAGGALWSAAFARRVAKRLHALLHARGAA